MSEIIPKFKVRSSNEKAHSYYEIVVGSEVTVTPSVPTTEITIEVAGSKWGSQTGHRRQARTESIMTGHGEVQVLNQYYVGEIMTTPITGDEFLAQWIQTSLGSTDYQLICNILSGPLAGSWTANEF